MTRLLGASRSRASFVGSATHAEFAANVPFPAAARPGDLAIITFLGGRTISGPAWTTMTGADANTIAYKILTAADIASPPSLSSDSNIVCMVVRGPTALSAIRTQITRGSGESSTAFTGFVKSAGCVGLYDAEIYRNPTAGSVDLGGGNPSPWSNGDIVGPEAYTLQCRVGLTPSKYADNQAWVINCAADAGTKSVSVHELLF